MARGLGLPREFGPTHRPGNSRLSRGLEVWDSYANGVLLVDDSALRAIGDALQIAEESSDDLALGAAKYALGVALMNRGASDR